MERRGGIGRNFLTRRNGPSMSLLKTVGGRPTRGLDDLVVGAAPRRRSPATDDEPQSSTDEEDDQPSLPPSLKPSNVDPDSATDRRRTTRFRDPRHYGTGAVVQDHPADREGIAEFTAQGGGGDSTLAVPSRRSTRKSSSSPKRSLDEMQGGTDAHLRDDFGFITSSQTQKKSKRGITYGSQGQLSLRSLGSKSNGSHQGPRQLGFVNPLGRHNSDTLEKQEGLFASRAFEDPSKKFAAQLRACIGEGKEKTNAFKMPQNIPSGILSSSQEEKCSKLKMPQNMPSDVLSSSREDQDFKLRIPQNVSSDILSSSQEDQGSKLEMPQNVPSGILSSSQEDQGPEFKMPTALPLSPPRRLKKPVVKSPRAYRTRNSHCITEDVLDSRARSGELRKILDESHLILSNGSSSKPSEPTEAYSSSSSSPLSSPPDSPIFISSQEAQGGFTGKRDIFGDGLTARCPMCREAVDADFLSSFGDGRAMNVRKQTRFCRAHKQKSAKVEWAARGYPDIKWDDLQPRIEKYYSELEDVLAGRSSSYFKENLEANFRSGKNRTLAQSIMSSDFQALTPGYYGSRGARIMMDSIMSKFTDQIRKLAPKDRLISSGGISSFVQTVMVPELAVLLVQEDMGLDSDMARKVLVDSIDIGDLLNEDDDDDVR